MANVLERLLSLESIVKDRDLKIDQLNDRVEALERLIQGNVPDGDDEADEDKNEVPGIDGSEEDEEELVYTVRRVRTEGSRNLKIHVPPIYLREHRGRLSWVRDVKLASFYSWEDRNRAMQTAQIVPYANKHYGSPHFILKESL